MKITDMVISAILKKGILYEARNVNVEFEIPTDKLGDSKEEDKPKTIKIHVKADHMQIQIEKGNEGA